MRGGGSEVYSTGVRTKSLDLSRFPIINKNKINERGFSTIYSKTKQNKQNKGESISRVQTLTHFILI
jgi:hypothetical protein